MNFYKLSYEFPLLFDYLHLFSPSNSINNPPKLHLSQSQLYLHVQNLPLNPSKIAIIPTFLIPLSPIMSRISFPLWRWCWCWRKDHTDEPWTSPEPPPDKELPPSANDSITLALPSSHKPSHRRLEAASPRETYEGQENAVDVHFSVEFFPVEDDLELPEPAQVSDGLYRYKAGNVYRGEWRNRKKDGYGEMMWSERRGYKGHWVQNWPEGQGSIQLNADLSFTGKWVLRDYQGIESLPLIPAFEKWLSAVDDGYSTL